MLLMDIHTRGRQLTPQRAGSVRQLTEQGREANSRRAVVQNGTMQQAGRSTAPALLPAEKAQMGPTTMSAGSQPAAEGDSDEDGPSRPPMMRLPPTRAARRPLRAGAAVRCVSHWLSVVQPEQIPQCARQRAVGAAAPSSGRLQTGHYAPPCRAVSFVTCGCYEMPQAAAICSSGAVMFC